MAKPVARSHRFSERGGLARNGIAMIFDLEGFSKFFNQPDIHEYIPKYLNHVLQAVDVCIFGGRKFWLPDQPKLDRTDLLPVHRKFLGDGVLYLWTPAKGKEDFSQAFIFALANRMWNLKNEFAAVNRAASETVPVVELPPRIRIGIARGTVFELPVEGRPEPEYIGFCINLASRLQGYCPALGFLASARLDLPQDLIDRHGYARVVATRIKGFPKEMLFVDREEYARLQEATKKNLFQELA